LAGRWQAWRTIVGMFETYRMLGEHYEAELARRAERPNSDARAGRRLPGRVVISLLAVRVGGAPLRRFRSSRANASPPETTT
jgi:hypothetical protein